MTRNWKALGVAALLAAAVAAPQARPDSDKPATVPEQLKDIQAALHQMNQNFERIGNDMRDMGLRGAKAARDVRDLQDRVTLIEQELRSQRSMLRGVQAAMQDVRDLQDRVALEPRPAPPGAAGRQALSYTPTQDLRNLEERLAALEARLRGDERRFSFTPEAPRRTGSLRLENRSAYDATVRVNGIPYVVPAFDTRLVRNVPTGSFNYEVMANGFGVIQPPVNRTLSPGETFIVYVNP